MKCHKFLNEPTAKYYLILNEPTVLFRLAEMTMVA